MIVGSDWRKKYVVGSELVKMVYFFDRMEEYSTTKILEGLK
jgi:bifunctional ADP-heptose synthase (sugar kinase/adenylyltransferase)